MMNHFGFLDFGILGPLIFLIALAVLAFELWMFISVIRNDKITDTTKVLWALGMLLIHPFVAIAYYFTDYQKTK